MVRNTSSAAALVAGGLIAAAAGTVNAGGIGVYEAGTSEVGLATAGYGALAQDASTILSNVAGMTRLEGERFSFGAQSTLGNVKFNVASAGAGLGSGDGGNAFKWIPSGSAFYSHSLSRDLKVGIGMASTFGAGLKYNDDWVGRYYVQKGGLLSMSMLPSVAWRMNERLSLGASLNAMYGYVAQQVAINNVLGPDGQMKYSDGKWGYGFNLGALYEMGPGSRVGLTYNSEVKLKFKSQPEFSGLSTGLEALLANRGIIGANLRTSVNVPQGVMLSGYHQIHPQWALLASLGWQQWSRFGMFEIGLDSNNPQTAVTNLQFKDTWHGAVGAQFKLSDPWTLNFGVAYDSKYQGANVSPVLPSNDAWRTGFGAQQQVTKQFLWGVATEYIRGGKTSVARTGSAPVAVGGRGDLAGNYDSMRFFVLTAYFNLRF